MGRTSWLDVELVDILYSTKNIVLVLHYVHTCTCTFPKEPSLEEL